jgi:hypothetical protein
MLAHGDLAEARLPRNVKVPQVQSRRGVWAMTFMKRVAPVVDPPHRGEHCKAA